MSGPYDAGARRGCNSRAKRKGGSPSPYAPLAVKGSPFDALQKSEQPPFTCVACRNRITQIEELLHDFVGMAEYHLSVLNRVPQYTIVLGPEEVREIEMLTGLIKKARKIWRGE